MAQSVRQLVFGAVVLAGVVLAVPRPCSAVVCSVFSHHPCVYRPYHQVCSVFRPRACTPELNYPFSEQLQLTIESRGSAAGMPARSEQAPSAPKHDLRTIREVFAALRNCWVPPTENHSKYGTQLSVRLSFKRGGEIFGEPRMTYITPGSSREVREAYWVAIMAALSRCTPLGFSKGLGGALAGRPFAIRFVDNRERS
jgi:hypothetical protein